MTLPEVCCSIFENLHILYTNETGESIVDVTSAHNGVEVGEVAVLPDPHKLED